MFFYHPETDESSWDHPRDPEFQKLVQAPRTEAGVAADLPAFECQSEDTRCSRHPVCAVFVAPLYPHCARIRRGPEQFAPGVEGRGELGEGARARRARARRVHGPGPAPAREPGPAEARAGRKQYSSSYPENGLLTLRALDTQYFIKRRSEKEPPVILRGYCFSSTSARYARPP